MRQRSRRYGGPVQTLTAGVEGCPAPASPPVRGLAGPKLTQVTGFAFPLSVLVLNKRCEMEEETVSPLGPTSRSLRFLHAAWKASEAGLEDQCLCNTVLKTVP